MFLDALYWSPERRQPWIRIPQIMKMTQWRTLSQYCASQKPSKLTTKQLKRIPRLELSTTESSYITRLVILCWYNSLLTKEKDEI